MENLIASFTNPDRVMIRVNTDFFKDVRLPAWRVIIPWPGETQEFKVDHVDIKCLSETTMDRVETSPGVMEQKLHITAYPTGVVIIKKEKGKDVATLI